MKLQEQKLKDIQKEREILIRDISIAQARLAELNIRRQNIIMA